MSSLFFWFVHLNATNLLGGDNFFPGEESETQESEREKEGERVSRGVRTGVLGLVKPVSYLLRGDPTVFSDSNSATMGDVYTILAQKYP